MPSCCSCVPLAPSLVRTHTGKLPGPNISSLGPSVVSALAALRKRRSSEFRVRDSSSSSASLRVSSPCPHPADPADTTPASCACCATPVAPAPSASRSAEGKEKQRREFSSHLFQRTQWENRGSRAEHPNVNFPFGSCY